MKSFQWKNLLLVVGSIVITLLLLEVVARAVLEPPQVISYEQFINVPQRIPEDGVFMQQPNTDYTFDITGLYAGADQLRLRANEDRFLRPVPENVDEATNKVLFLGGSTTESYYVDEPLRWVYLLNEPGEIATYNAALSGVGTAAEYDTFQYLTDAGHEFDLVVLSTMINDFAWSDRFHSNGLAYIPDDLEEGLHRYNRQEYQDYLDRTDPLAGIARRVRLMGFVRQALNQEQTAAQSVVERLDAQQQRRRQEFGEPQPLAECDEYQQLLDWYEADLRHNLALFKSAVEATGAEFLVMTEGNSYDAPSESFLIDLRVPATCDDAAISYPEMVTLLAQTGEIYLSVAQDLGIDTFDLAAEINQLTNSSEGGRYMYDSIHYTDVGAQAVAEILRPVIAEYAE